MSTVESWFAPAVVAEPLPKPRSRRAPASAKPKTRKQSGRSFRVRLPVVWMVLVAVLLVGVVAVNVAVLRANVSVNDLDTKIAQLKGENANIASQYSRVTAPPRVENAAAAAHLVPAPGANTQYLDMVPRR